MYICFALIANSARIMGYDVIILLIVSGIAVGIINTLAGGGSIITMTVFMVLGLPITVANGTNRIAVLLQNLTATVTFIRKRMLDIKSGLLLSIPVIIGNIAGSLVATHIDERVFKICFAVVLFIILMYMIFDNHKRFHGGQRMEIKPQHYLWFLLIGFYSGYIYIGLGYLILAISLWSMKLDIITANVIKGFVIFIATHFALIIFMLHGHVDYYYGLLHGAGNMIGAYMASHWFVGWGGRFVKIFTTIIVMICFADLVGLLSLHDIFSAMLNR